MGDTTNVSAAAPPLSIPIALTTAEQELFAYLLRVCEHAQHIDANAAVVELRVCGGWVRDKLLSRASNDIDIALDTMTGRDFVERINAFERACGRKERVAGVMKARPEQSKAMEVATVPFRGVGKVDFVAMCAALACETHDADATATATELVFGTPLQDAERRDFTINSLFYNLSTQHVEDPTGKGLADLRDGILRTPLDARTMLLDDPMRVLRAVRFASQLDFALEPSLRTAIEQHDVRVALATRISRQRLGQVLVTTLAGASAHPQRAVRLLRDLQLLEPVLFPRASELAVVQQSDGRAAAAYDHAIWTRSAAYAEQMCALVGDGTTHRDEREGVSRNDSEQHALKLRLLAAVLLPFVGHHIEQRDVSVPTYMIRESLGLSNQDARDVDVSVFRSLEALQLLVHSDTFDLKRVALLLRAIRPHWRLCCDVALVQELVDCGLRSSSPSSASASRCRITEHYDAFTALVVATGLDDVCLRTPLLSGGELVRELHVAPGAAVKQMLERVFVWQVEHPDGTRDECLAHFQAQQ